MTTPLTTAPLLGEPLVIELMNTLWADRDGVHDALESAGDAVAWLRAVSTRPDVRGVDLVAWLDDTRTRARVPLAPELRRLRDAARRLAARQTDDAREPALNTLDAQLAVEIVNTLASGHTARPVLAWPDREAPTLTMTSDAALGAAFIAGLARSAVRFFGGGTRDQLRACHAPGCVLYFVKQHPRREWCSAGCGNRARVARHYQRHHA